MRDVPLPNAVRLELERAREEKGPPLLVAVMLNVRAASLDVPFKVYALALHDKAAGPTTGDEDT